MDKLGGPVGNTSQLYESVEVGGDVTCDRTGGVQRQWWLLATTVVTRRVCGIVFPCTVIAGIISFGMQGNEGDGQWVRMMATMTARRGGC
jgi:hypothetical protein